MKIFGRIRNLKNNAPVQGAVIKLKIKNAPIASIPSDEDGRYKYSTETDYTGQHFDIIIEKDGFDTKYTDFDLNVPTKELNFFLKSKISKSPIEEFDKSKQKPDMRSKLRISGKVLNSRNKASIQGAQIKLKIKNDEIAPVLSDEQGRYKKSIETDYNTGQILDITVEKVGFETKKFSHEITEPDIQKNYEMDEITILINGKIFDEKTNNPLENANIIFKINKEYPQKLISSKEGIFSFDIPWNYLNEFIEYEALKDGYRTKSEKVQVKENLSIDVGLSKEPPIPKFTIYGTIQNSKNKAPVQGANIKLTINNTPIASVSSDEHGEYVYSTEKDYIGQPLDIIIEKEGFENKIHSEKIAKHELQLNFSLNEEIEPPILLDMRCTLNRDFLTHRGGIVYMGINIKARDKVEKRLPVRICFVIDSSGSMKGDKIINAKKAAIEFIGKLDSIDYAGLVTFASKVQVIDAGEHVIDKSIFYDNINKIKAGGATELYKGLSQAFEELKKSTFTKYEKGREPVKKIILLSDGNPTDGIKVDKYEKLVKELRNSGISVAAFGLGDDYNEDLLSIIAENSGGTWNHITSSQDLSSVFLTELDAVKTVVYTAPELILQEGTSVEIDKMYLVEPEISLIEGKNKYRLRDIQAGETQKLVARARIPPREDLEKGEVLETHIKVATVKIVIPVDPAKSNYRTAASEDIIAKYTKDNALLAIESNPYPRSMFVTAETTIIAKKAISDRTVLIEAKDKIDTILKDPSATNVPEVKGQVTKLKEMLSRIGINKDDKKKMKSEITKTRVRL